MIKSAGKNVIKKPIATPDIVTNTSNTNNSKDETISVTKKTINKKIPKKDPILLQQGGDHTILVQSDKSTENSKVKRIFHLSDIHIPKEKRYSIFKTVFDRLFADLKAKGCDKETDLIVVTGDIIDSKHILTAQTILLLKYFFVNLTNLAPCIVIVGNHDMAGFEDVDSISPVIKDNFDTVNKIHLLLNNGIYQYKNILFGLTTMEASAVTICPKMDEFIPIALYHGILHGCTNNIGKDLAALSERDRFSTTQFFDAGYEYILLGDVHKFQYLNKAKTAWYPSSLIQLSHGEGLEDHGYILLDLQTKKTEYVRIKNDHAFINLVLEKDGSMDFNLDSLPLYSDIRIIYKTADEKLKAEARKKIEKKTQIVSYMPISHYIENGFNTNVMMGKDNQNLLDVQDKDHFRNIILDFIKENQKLEPVTLKRIGQKLDEIITVLKVDDNKNSKNIIFKTLKFSNISLYGEYNELDFQKMKGIVGMSEANSAGKTSLCECIPISLYGICPNNRGTRADFIRKGASKAFTEIIVEVNNVVYTIRRDFKRNNKSTQVVEHVIITKNDETLFNNNKEPSKKKKKSKKQKNDSDDVTNDTTDAEDTDVEEDNITDAEDVEEAEDAEDAEEAEDEEEEDEEEEDEEDEEDEEIKKDIDHTNFDKKLKKADNQTEGKINATQLINNLICSYDDLYMTMMVGQPRTINFTTNTNKTELILKYSGLGIFNTLATIAGNNATLNTQKCGLIYNNKTLDNLVSRNKPKKGVSLNDFRDAEILKIKELTKDTKNKLQNEKQLLESGLEVYEKELQKYSEQKVRLEEQLKKYEGIDFSNNENADELQEELDAYKTTITKINNKNNNYEKEIETKKQMLTKANKNLTKYSDILNEKKIFDTEKKNKINILNKKINNLNKQLKGANNTHSINKLTEKQILLKISQLQKTIESDEKEMLELDKQIKELKQKLVFENVTEIKENYKKVSDNDDNIHQLEQKIDILNNDLLEFQGLHKGLENHDYNPKCKYCITNSLTKAKEYLDEKTNGLEEKIKKLNVEITKENKKKKQNEKYRHDHELYMEYIENYDEYREVLTDTETNYCNKIVEIKANKEKIIDYENAISNIKINLDITTAEEEINEIDNEEFEKYKEYENLQEHVGELKQNIADLSLSFEKNKNIIHTTEIKITELEQLFSKINKCKEDYTKYRKLLNDLNNCEKQYKQNLSLVTKTKIDYKKKESELNKCITQFETINNAYDQYIEHKRNREEYEIIQKMLTYDDGIIRKILKNEILPKMENTINQMLIAIGFQPLSIALAINKNKRKMNNIIIKSQGLSDIAVIRKGYFESSMIEMIFRMALSQINQFTKTNCIIVDEIYDGCANENRDKVTTLIEYFKEYYQFMLVISHNEHIVGLFNNRIFIKKDSNTNTSYLEFK